MYQGVLVVCYVCYGVLWCGALHAMGYVHYVMLGAGLGRGELVEQQGSISYAREAGPWALVSKGGPWVLVSQEEASL